MNLLVASQGCSIFPTSNTAAFFPSKVYLSNSKLRSDRSENLDRSTVLEHYTWLHVIPGSW